MESVGYVLVTLAMSTLVSAVALVVFLIFPLQRQNPGLWLVTSSVLAAFASFVAALFLATFFGISSLDALVLSLAVASWIMVAPVLIRASVLVGRRKA